MLKKKLPKRMYQYFWDVEPGKIDIEDKDVFVIKRILEYGNTMDLAWLKDNFGLKGIEKTLLQTRDLSRKTGTYWAQCLDINKEKVLCLQTPYHPIPFGV